jgi:3D (Asp-Asp-Asp) domain-containing protein/septal ring factor EnvC (AmiA/AmiB activator)
MSQSQHPPVVRSRLVRGPARLQARLLVAGVCAIGAGAAATAGGAGTPTLHQRSQALRNANAALATRARSVALDLYSIESRLQHAQATLSVLQEREAQLERERTSVRTRIAIAHQNLRLSQHALALRVHVLYEQQPTDPLAVVLGAQSLDEAITTLDDLSRSAQQNIQVATESKRAATSLGSLARTLAAQDAQVRTLTDAAARTAASLNAAQASRQSFVAQLSVQQRLNNSQIASLELQASNSAARNGGLTAQTALSPVSATTPVAPPAGAGTGRTMTVSATGYALGGTTATGVPVGWGVVAVDPTVIPLGTRMTIPGYGDGVAADTGSAVRGATIDLWFPTVAQALAWGRRTVTITIH